jgi:hypothetical protein
MFDIQTGDFVVVRKSDGRFDVCRMDTGAPPIVVSASQFPNPTKNTRKIIAGAGLWMLEEATHTIDLTNAHLKELTGCAARVAKLVSRTPAPNVDQLGALDDLLGAIYALITAEELGYQGKTSQSDLKALRDRSNDVAAGKVRFDGSWMGGYHFNSALFRISAIFDRLPKALTCCHVTSEAAYRTKKGIPWDKKYAHKIRKQVNRMKHVPGGTFPARIPKRRPRRSAGGDQGAARIG